MQIQRRLKNTIQSIKEDSISIRSRQGEAKLQMSSQLKVNNWLELKK